MKINKNDTLCQIIAIFVLIALSNSHSYAALTLKLTDGANIKLYESSHALILGASDYRFWPKLPGVKYDVQAVKIALLKHGFKVDVAMNPTRASFGATIRDFIGKYGLNPNNRLLFYFAGHGHTLTTQRGRQLGYIIPVDSPTANNLGAFKSKAISMLEMEIFAKEIEAKHALFMFDSCFSGSLFELSRAAPPIISSKLALPVRQFITAGSANQTVPDVSIFRAQFVDALNGSGDINNDGYITGTELAQFLEEKVTNYSNRAQTPRYGKIRDPILDKGDIVFQRSNFKQLSKKYSRPGVDSRLAQQQTILNKIKLEQQKLAKMQLNLEQPGTGRHNYLLENIKNRSVAIVARAEVGTNARITSQKYTNKVSKLMNKQIKKYLPNNTTIMNIKNISETRNFSYDGSEGRYSKKICNNQQTSFVFGGIMEDDEGSQGYLRSMEYFIYNCDKNRKSRLNFTPKFQNNDKFARQISLKEQLNKFMKDFIAQ